MTISNGWARIVIFVVGLGVGACGCVALSFAYYLATGGAK
jgi:hypothetical protein